MSRRHASSGQSLVEMALILPVFLLILMGAIDVGRAVWFQNQVEQLANQAARQAAVISPDGTCAGLSKTACVNAIVAGQRIGTDATATADCRRPDGTDAGTFDTCSIGEVIHVTVTASWSAVTPIVSQILGPRTFGSQANLPVE